MLEIETNHIRIGRERQRSPQMLLIHGPYLAMTRKLRQRWRPVRTAAPVNPEQHDPTRLPDSPQINERFRDYALSVVPLVIFITLSSAPAVAHINSGFAQATSLW